MVSKSALPVIASEAKQSSPAVIDGQPFVQPKRGWLRFARHDGGDLAWSLSFPASGLIAKSVTRS